MSTTALVRSTSSSSSLAAPSTQTKTLTPTSTTSLPKLSATPPSKDMPSAKPSTPTTQPQPSPAQLTPGRWQHPRMDEIIRRQNKTNFDRSNVRIIAYNLLYLFLSFLIPAILKAKLPISWTLPLQPYDTYTLLALRAFTLLNMGLACAPLFRMPDACEDIPLDPAQRKLLGLPPMSRPATPQEKEQWVTPPRYSRSNTPRSAASASSSVRAETSGSPLSGRGTPLPNSTTYRFSPASGSPASQLRNGAERRRLSYNSTRSSPLSISDFDAAGGSLSTPTKGNNRSSLGLNNKWLYEKGKAFPGLSGFGGRGSVFS